MKHLHVLIVSAAIGAALAGCPRIDDTTAPGPVVAPPAVQPAAEVAEPAAPAADPAAEAQPPRMERRAKILSVQVVPIDVAQAEDGRGAEVAATAPVAIEIAAEAWPVRALDPVLRVGDLVLRHYTFPRVNVLRFVIADGARIPAGTPAWVQYGDDDASRVEVAASLEVPR